jgi:uncharacterized protein with ParB-like and HNH nuclease domain
MTANLTSCFTPKVLSIKQIFGDTDSYYQIPDYQRPYSWETKQVEELWDDIYSAMEKGEQPYFLGATILTETGEGHYDVVDGQQRLTTLMILFCVLRDLNLANNNVVCNAIKSLIDDKYRLRLITQSHNQGQFENEILEQVKFPEEHLTDREREANLFINTALIFKERLEAIGDKALLDRFVAFLMDQVVMISIVSSNQAFAIRLFQVLNARGLPLSNADLIKSYLYSRCDKDKLPQFKQDWVKIETISKELDEEGLGDVETLLSYFSYYYLVANPQESVFAELTGHKDFKNADPTKISYELATFAEALKKVVTMDSRTIYPMWYLPHSIYWCTILATAIHNNYPDFEPLALELRRLYYGYWIAGYTVTKIKQLSFNIIGWVKNGEPFENIKKKIDKKMDEDEIARYAREALNKNAYGERWAKALLLLLEYYSVDDSKPVYIRFWDKKLHVEHVLPTAWNSNPASTKAWDESAATHWVNKLGNLTLISGKKNIAASNDSFEKKKITYKKTHGGLTAFEISKEVATLPSWSESEVKDRQQVIKKKVVDILGL